VVSAPQYSRGVGVFSRSGDKIAWVYSSFSSALPGKCQSSILK
jgi:hypothetical protein